MPNISPAQVAEGARLLEAKNTQGMSYDAFMSAANKLNAWLYNHADALLAAAQRTVNAETVLKELLTEYHQNRDMAFRLRDQSKDQAKRECHDTRGLEWNEAAETLLSLAKFHNIDLSEPTPAGETKRGTL